MVVLIWLDHSSGTTKPLDIVRCDFHCIITQLIFLVLKPYFKLTYPTLLYAQKSPGHLVKVASLIGQYGVRHLILCLIGLIWAWACEFIIIRWVRGSWSSQMHMDCHKLFSNSKFHFDIRNGRVRGRGRSWIMVRDWDMWHRYWTGSFDFVYLGWWWSSSLSLSITCHLETFE